MRTLTSVLCASALLLGAAACGEEEPAAADKPSSTIARDSGKESTEEANTTTTSEAPVWPGPVRAPSDVVHLGWGQSGWVDPLDTSVGWADVERLTFNVGNQGQWFLSLAASPPPLEYLEPGVVVAYGLVLDTDADGAADYVAGIDNDAPRPGDVREWITDLATGETDEHVGPPYGEVIDFAYPVIEHSAPDWLSGDMPDVFLTFYVGGAPADMDLDTVRFYVWTSAARDGLVFAHDDAPDSGWLAFG